MKKKRHPFECPVVLLRNTKGFFEFCHILHIVLGVLQHLLRSHNPLPRPRLCCKIKGLACPLDGNTALDATKCRLNRDPGRSAFEKHSLSVFDSEAIEVHFDRGVFRVRVFVLLRADDVLCDLCHLSLHCGKSATVTRAPEWCESVLPRC